MVVVTLTQSGIPVTYYNPLPLKGSAKLKLLGQGYLQPFKGYYPLDQHRVIHEIYIALGTLVWIRGHNDYDFLYKNAILTTQTTDDQFRPLPVLSYSTKSAIPHGNIHKDKFPMQTRLADSLSHSERYGSMLTDYFWREIEDYDLEAMWIQQDGAKSHTTLAHSQLEPYCKINFQDALRDRIVAAFSTIAFLNVKSGYSEDKV
ncbi:hypothetical protein HUJ04_008297 [Dendroctonus ponderosae]|nr:hypothetical protein HUJ04_008297 [Dendroctonus ponderosae]